MVGALRSTTGLRIEFAAAECGDGSGYSAMRSESIRAGTIQAGGSGRLPSPSSSLFANRMGHHFVPQQYLRAFSDQSAPDKIWLYLKSGEPGRLVSIKKAAHGEVSGPTETGTRRAEEEKAPLSSLIEKLNARFETEFDAQDLIDGVTEQLVADEQIQEAARVNDKANFGFVLRKELNKVLVDRHDGHRQFIDRLFGDVEMMAFFRRVMLDEVYGRLSADSRGPTAGEQRLD